jgi:hypothetical protein
MIRWIRNKLHNFIFPQPVANEIAVSETPEADIEGLRFTVMPARGGTIVQIRTYDTKRDSNQYTTYVIPDGQDIAEEVGRIVSMELIRA